LNRVLPRAAWCEQAPTDLALGVARPRSPPQAQRRLKEAETRKPVGIRPRGNYHKTLSEGAGASSHPQQPQHPTPAPLNQQKHETNYYSRKTKNKKKRSYTHAKSRRNNRQQTLETHQKENANTTARHTPAHAEPTPTRRPKEFTSRVKPASPVLGSARRSPPSVAGTA